MRREDEGTRSNRPELGGLLLALEATSKTDDLLVACDNEAVLKVIRKWVGQGGKATLATAPDADILRDVLGQLHNRIQAGAATFLVKVKSHRGEPINERADTLQHVTAEWEPAFLRQAREFPFFPLKPREASKSIPIFDRGTESKPERLRSGFLQADLSLIV